MSAPNQTYEVHAPETTDDQGYAYSPVVTNIEAPNIETAVQISNNTIGPSHEVGQGGDGEYVVYHGH